MKTTPEVILFRWLDKAFAEGQDCPKFSDQRSEYFGALFHRDWAPKILRELKAALAAAETLEPEVSDE